MSKITNVCNNCGKQGHLLNYCKLPITSYGVILFKIIDEQKHYLMIRRKNTFGYIDILRGKYLPYNICQLENFVNEMSIFEKNNLLSDVNFQELWKEMWGAENIQYKNEESTASKKFEIIKTGILVNDEIMNIHKIINNSTTNWEEPEWEFPKGRRNYKERDLECALREFEEETGINQDKITIIENVLPFEETFIGTNYKSYKHKYFLAMMNDNEPCELDNFQKSEVSRLEWKTIDNCLESIRPYNLEKKKIIININKVLEEYRLYL